MSQQGDYRELIVWQKAMGVVVSIYRLTASFPSTEVYGLTSQMRRASVSLPSNIAEGRRRGSEKEFRHFLHIAFGSGAELETQLEIARKLGFGKVEEIDAACLELDEVMRMLNRLSSE